MKFFVPGATTPAEAEQGFATARNFAIETLGWETSQRRVHKLVHVRDGKTVTHEVGQLAPANQQTVMAIVESTTYLVFTETRGFVRGMPFFVGKDEVTLREDFE